jgi:hypothetical protein
LTAGEEQSKHSQKYGQRHLAHGKLHLWLRCLKKKGKCRR